MKNAVIRASDKKCVRPTVLVVDDDPTLRLIIARSAAQCGFEVSAVSNVEDALAIARKTTFDLLTLDIMLGKQHGIDLLGRLQEAGFAVRPSSLQVPRPPSATHAGLR